MARASGAVAGDVTHAGPAPLDVDFDVSGSSDPDGSIVSYEWDFGDGDTGSGIAASHQFVSGGVYTVTLTVTDDGGAATTATDQVTVSSNQAPTASFSATPTSGAAPLDVDFDASGSSDPDGSIVSYEWDFGDGTSDSGETASHQYTSDGSFTVTLTVTDDEGATGTATDGVLVTGNAAPMASFDASPSSGVAPLDVDFDASGSSDPDGSIVSYDWDFGDGTTGSGETTSHRYTAEGSFTVTLTVVDDQGATATATDDIVVSSNLQPTASFSASAVVRDQSVGCGLRCVGVVGSGWVDRVV